MGGLSVLASPEEQPPVLFGWAAVVAEWRPYQELQAARLREFDIAIDVFVLCVKGLMCDGIAF
jgi:hypothetical protein